MNAAAVVSSVYKRTQFPYSTNFHCGNWTLRSKRVCQVADMRYMTSKERTYENAVKIIESRQRRARPTMSSVSIESSNQTISNSGTPDLRGTPGIAGMFEWLQSMGHSDDAINALNVTHVAGTKGKGSTCAFTESFLRAHSQRTGFPRKTGMYTSPHLLVPEERIRINSLPLSKAMFAQYFFEVYDRLPQLALDYDPAKPLVERGPRFLQLYALVAFHVFIREEVDVTVIETHSGGEYDATNVVTRPVVAAVTSLGMDHVQMLGPSIANIAWHKGGIYKAGAVALSTQQDPEPANVLVERARNVGVDLTFAKEQPNLPLDAIQLKPAVQRKNAALAVAAANALLRRIGPQAPQSLSDQDLRLGVEQWHWPGRFEIIPDAKRTWFLDAAHNDMSVEIAAEWFAESSVEMQSSATRVLIFSHINELRNAVAVLHSLANALSASKVQMQHVIFTTYTESEGHLENEASDDLARYSDTWNRVFPESSIWNESTIERAIGRAETLSRQISTNETHILITGSQHLVGPAHRILHNEKR